MRRTDIATCAQRDPGFTTSGKVERDLIWRADERRSSGVTDETSREKDVKNCDFASAYAKESAESRMRASPGAPRRARVTSAFTRIVRS